MIECTQIITRRIEFDAGHRVLGHEGKCACLHGHRYAAEITVRQNTKNQLDQIGRVVDFSCLKQIIGGWIDKYWDHNMILHRDDPLVRHFIGCGRTVEINNEKVTVGDIFPKTPYVMPGGRNPTAEEMAYELYTVCVTNLPTNLEVVRIRIYETPSCWADFIPEVKL